MRELGALLGLVGVLSVTAACGAEPSSAVAPAPSQTTVAAPSAKPTPTSSPTPTPTCGTASASAVAAIDAVVRAAGEGNGLTEAGVLADPDSGMWLVAGPFTGPAGEGEGAVGTWATSTDPTVEPFTGKVYAVDDAATNWSVAPRTKDVAFDPAYLPVMVCVPTRTG